MFGRLLRVTGTVLVIAVAFVTPVLATSTPASAQTVIDGCTIVANPTPTNFTSCPGVNLSGANLSGVNLSYANLSNANLSSANLTGLSVVSGTVTVSSGTNFTNANLSDAALVGAGLEDCMVVNGTPTLQAVDCFVPTFTGANMAGAQLNGTDLGGVDLSGVDLTGANLSSVTEPGCFTFNLGPNQVTQCPGPNLANSNLTDAILSGADLSNATLTSATFTGTLLIPSDQTVSATSAAGAVVTWPTPPSVPGATPGTCTPASGSTFPLGTTTVTCQVLDSSGDVATGTITVTVNPPPPTTSVLLPFNGATVIGDSWLDAGASSPVGLASVNFEVSGGTLSGSQVVSGSTPTLYGWIGAWNSTSIPNGTYTLQSVATDTDGVSTTSAPITITVNNPPPSTSMLIPSTGATQSGTAALLDAGSTADVTSVSYELSGGTLTNQVIATGAATIYGWLAEWNTTSVANGTYTLQSVGTYSGGTVTSAPITITVSN